MRRCDALKSQAADDLNASDSNVLQVRCIQMRPSSASEWESGSPAGEPDQSTGGASADGPRVSLSSACSESAKVSRFGLVKQCDRRRPDAEDFQQLFQLELGNGDLCSMEGMTQKYYHHRAPKDRSTGPRINLTWRYVKQHARNCPLSRK